LPSKRENSAMHEAEEKRKEKGEKKSLHEKKNTKDKAAPRRRGEGK